MLCLLLFTLALKVEYWSMYSTSCPFTVYFQLCYGAISQLIYSYSLSTSLFENDCSSSSSESMYLRNSSGNAVAFSLLYPTFYRAWRR